jgi:hypothetical protein
MGGNGLVMRDSRGLRRPAPAAKFVREATQVDSKERGGKQPNPLLILLTLVIMTLPA